MKSLGRRTHALALTLAVLTVTSIFAAVVAAPSVRAAAVPASGSTTLDVTASTGYAFTPNTFSNVPADANITVQFTDATVLSHTFTIIGKQGWVIPTAASDALLDELAWGNSPASLFNLNVSGSGTTVSGTFTSPGTGWYEFFCTEGGHFSYGMYGFIAFGEPLPANLTVSSGLPGPGAALFIIIGSIVSLVVIALVLGFVVGRRHGAVHEMPPERLGYPEPPAAGGPLPPSSDEPRHP
ncbi:MAG TPA: cupredoxin domain-containing protein [Thermoplasmata archaeon]|nr:cupredoxin domain-containing protein [Thermoplasmata archaeon]